MRTTRSRFSILSASVLIGSLMLAACGNGGTDAGGENTDGDTAAAPAGDQKTTLTIGMFPVVDATPGEAAKLHGIYEENGLDVTVEQTAGGAQAMASLVAGEFDIAFSNYVSIILGAHQGIPLVVASGNNIGHGDHTVMVAGDSDIQDPTDLEGKKVAVSHLQNIGVLAISNAIDEAGGDPSQVSFVELPFPDMQAALDRGDVDAMWMIEPFMAAAKEQGGRIVVENFSGTFEDIPVSGWVTTKEFAEQNPESLAAFAKSIDEAAQLISSDDEAMVETVKSFTRVDEGVLGDMVLPTWSGDVDKSGLEKISSAMTKFGFIDGTFDVANLVVHQG